MVVRGRTLQLRKGLDVSGKVKSMSVLVLGDNGIQHFMNTACKQCPSGIKMKFYECNLYIIYPEQ